MWRCRTNIGARLERYHRHTHLPFITSVTSIRINLMMREIFIETLNQNSGCYNFLKLWKYGASGGNIYILNLDIT